MSTKKKGEDDGVVTSAPASKVGSLLADMLNDAKAGVAQEQKKIETEVERKAREEREAREREEARKREEAQRKLIEEARLRNEALAKRDRAEGQERKALSTAPHMRPVAAEPAPVAAVAPAPIVAPAKATSKLLLAALVLVGIGLGFGASFALAPAQKDAGIDVGAAAKAVVAASRKQASAEGKFAAELDAARVRIGELQREVGEAQAATKNLEKVVEGLKADLATAQAAIEAGKAAQGGEPKTGPKRTGNGGSSIPGINGNVFNPK